MTEIISQASGIKDLLLQSRHGDWHSPAIQFAGRGIASAYYPYRVLRGDLQQYHAELNNQPLLHLVFQMRDDNRRLNFSSLR